MKRLSMALLLLAACVGPGDLSGETVGEQFRKALANVDAYCRERRIGPYLDPSDAEYRRKVTLMNCEVLKIKPFDLSAVLATPEGKFAYSIELPAPLDKPRVRRADYRSASEYFKALCEKEDGDHLFSSIAGVESVVALRTAPTGFRHRLGSYSEETLGAKAGGGQPEMLLVQSIGLKAVERRGAEESRRRDDPIAWRRYTVDSTKQAVSPHYGLKYELIPAPTAEVGILWRGTPALDAREEGIIGGELVVIQRSSSKVLAVRRTFTMDEVDLSVTDRVRHTSRSCPGTVITEGYELVSRVLGITGR